MIFYCAAKSILSDAHRTKGCAFFLFKRERERDKRKCNNVMEMPYFRKEMFKKNVLVRGWERKNMTQ